MKHVQFLISFITSIFFFNSSLVLAQTQSSEPQEDPRAFEVYLTYINPMMSNSYNIETPWIIKGPKESEESVLQRVEAQLRTRFGSESNFTNLPSWISSETMIFQRQVVCDSEKTELTGSYRQTLRNSSNEESEEQSTSHSASMYSNKEKTSLNGVGSEAKSFLQKQSESDSAYDSYKLNGYTIIKTEEKIYTTSCVKKHYEFRGKLLAERVLSITQIDKNIKLYLVRKSLDKVYTNFVSRYKYLSGLLQYVLTSPNLTTGDVTKLGYANSGDLVANIKTELSSLISTYKYFSSTSSLFKNYHYNYFSESIDGITNDIKLKLTSIKSFLESYEPNIITFGVLSESQIQSLYLFSQEELVGLFSPIGTFNFQSRVKNPLQQTITYYENKAKEVSQCQVVFNSLVQLTKQSASELPKIEDKKIDFIKSCSNTLTMSLEYREFVKYIKTYNCVIQSYSCSYGDCFTKLQCQ